MAKNSEKLTGKQKQASRKKQLTSRRTLSERLDVSPATMWRREQQPDFPRKIYVGKSVFFDADEADEYVERLMAAEAALSRPELLIGASA